MNSNISFYNPSEGEMHEIVKAWWGSLDAVKGQVPKVGVPSGDDYVFLYGHYEGNGPNAALAHEGQLGEQYIDRIVVCPIINGRYGIGEEYIGKELGDVDTGVLLSQYTNGLYASLIRDNILFDIPQLDWVYHEKPKAHELESRGGKRVSVDGYYFGMWICIEKNQLKKNDTLKFGGKGGPFVGGPSSPNKNLPDETNQRIFSNYPSLKNEWLQRFETHAIWKI